MKREQCPSCAGSGKNKRGGVCRRCGGAGIVLRFKSFVLEDEKGNFVQSFKARTPRAAALKAARRGHSYIRLRECGKVVAGKGCLIHHFIGTAQRENRVEPVFENVAKKGVLSRDEWGLIRKDVMGVDT